MAGRAAITLAAVTVKADPKHREAPAATDHGRVGASSIDGYLMKVAQRGLAVVSGEAPQYLPTVEDEGTPQPTPRMIDG